MVLDTPDTGPHHPAPARYAKAKAVLVAEISKTELGRFLLDDLKKRNIALVLATDMSALSMGSDVQTGGYWDPKNRRIVLNVNNPLENLLHNFAHETRHSAQQEVAGKLDHAVENLHPVNLVLQNRLQEMDADAFAVYFLADHSIKVKSDHFNKLSAPREGDAGLRAIFGAAAQNIDRSGMYRSFLQTWREKDKDMALAMREAAATLFDDRLVNKMYDALVLQQWSTQIWPQLVAASRQPGSASAQALRGFFQNFRDGKFQSPEDNLIAQAKAYSGLYAEAGVPDYLAGADGRLFDFLSKDAKGADEIWSGAMPGLKDKFSEACNYFLDKMPATATPASPAKKRRAAAKADAAG